jgi:hypothetical protein
LATATQQQKINTQIHDPGMLNICTEEARAQSAGDLDKRENLSRKEFFNEYAMKNRPVVLKDACKDWKAIVQVDSAIFQRKLRYKECAAIRTQAGTNRG